MPLRCSVQRGKTRGGFVRFESDVMADGTAMLSADYRCDGPDLKVGDSVVVSGSANRDPDVRIVTLLTAVSRTSDGWKWERPSSSAGRCTERAIR